MATIMVTGVGAIMGYGILRMLRRADPALRLIGTDIYPDAVGADWADVFVQALPVSDPRYRDFLAGLVCDHAVDLIIPGIQQDVDFLAGNGRGIGAALALNNPDLIALAGDKWSAHEVLCSLGLPAIPSRITGDFAILARDLGLPFLLKPRRGQAAKGIVRITEERDFDYWGRNFGPVLMAQRIVGDDDAEFTVSGFGAGDGGIGQLVALRRRLDQAGATGKATLVSEAPFRDTIDTLARALRPEGPTNFQFRVEDGTPFLLEINPRISSASSIRDAFGYNEAAMCVDWYLRRRLPRQVPLRSGSVVRYTEDWVRHAGDHS